MEKCLGPELCRKLIDMLPMIGYDIARHRCYEESNAEMVEDQAPNQPKHPNHPTTQNHPSSSKHLSPRNKHLLKRSNKSPQNYSATYARVLPVNPPHPPKPTHPTPHLITGGAAPDRGAWPAGDGWPGLQSLWAEPRPRGVPTGRARWAPDLQGYGRWGFPPTHGQWAPELQDRGPTEGGCLGGLGRARKARAKPKQQNEAKQNKCLKPQARKKIKASKP